MPNVTARGSRLDDLLKEEIELKNHIERVAESRRRLDPGEPLQEYVFREGPANLARNEPSDILDVRLSELFEPGKPELLVYHYMFKPGDELPCPMCTMWIDGFNGVAEHVCQRTNFAIIAKADIGKLRRWARSRGWTNLRLLSSHDSTFNRDLGAEDEDGDQIPGVSVFVKGSGGDVRHVYTKHATLDDDNNRGIDLFSPVWNLFDMLPSGRGDWSPSVDYRRP